MKITNSSTASPLLRVGLLGCGRLADHHVRVIKSFAGAQLVGVADVLREAASAFAAKHGIPAASGSLEELLDSTSLDVLHVVTPPAYHYESARLALDRSLHVLLEKPLAFSVDEVRDLYHLADERRVMLCPDFIQLFHPKMQELLKHVRSGEIGAVKHVETQLFLNPEDTAEMQEAEGLHWSYQLPGGLLRDHTTHALYLALYFAGWPEKMDVTRKSYGCLPQGLPDHIVAQIDGTKCTAVVTVSCVTKPSSYMVRVYGELGNAEVNFDTQTTVVNRQTALPRRIKSGIAPFTQSWTICTQSLGNVVNYLRGKLMSYAGMQELIPRFYSAILKCQPPPVTSEVATAVTHAEQEIFSNSPRPCVAGPYLLSSQAKVRRPEKVLVTGANGYVGLAVVKALVGSGYSVRALVRPTAFCGALKDLGVEVFVGDIRRLDDVQSAAAQMDIVIHLAAGIRGSAKFIVDSCVRGTENVAKAARSQSVRRVVYMSSMSVYDFAALRNGDTFTEDSALEPYAEERGAYTIGKRRAEEVALAQLADAAPAWTIVRPGTIVGRPRVPEDAVGSRLGRTLICPSSPRKHLLLVHIDDVATAILAILGSRTSEGQIYTLCDPEPVMVREYVKVLTRFDKRLRVIYVRYAPARLAAALLRLGKKVTGIGPNVNRRRLLSLYRDVTPVSSRLHQHTGWEPGGRLLERMAREAEGVAPETEETLPAAVSHV